MNIWRKFSQVNSWFLLQWLCQSETFHLCIIYYYWIANKLISGTYDSPNNEIGPKCGIFIATFRRNLVRFLLKNECIHVIGVGDFAYKAVRVLPRKKQRSVIGWEKPNNLNVYVVNVISSLNSSRRIEIWK